MLKTTEGALAESSAIARYVSETGTCSTALLGKDALERAKINSWLEFSANDIEVPATVICYPIVGWMALHQEAFEKAKKDLNASLRVLEGHLKTRTYLVTEAISLADITLATALLLPFKLMLDAKARKALPCTTRWFTTCVNQPAFIAVLGNTVLCTTALVPKGYSEKSAPPKKSGKDAKKSKETKDKSQKNGTEAAPAPKPAAKKPKHYCELLPKSPFVLDEWKRKYSNAPGGDCYKVMPWFWENLDTAGYSVYMGDYNYNAELTVSFMVSNLAGGFVQRCDEIRKYAFGLLQILKKSDNEFVLKGCWLFRGDSEKLMLEANPDAEHYTWTKLDTSDASVQQKVADMWCAWEKIDGLEIVDCKVFK